MIPDEDTAGAETTAVPEADDRHHAEPPIAELALAVAWCQGETQRLGELVDFPRPIGRIAAEFGRGTSAPGAAPRLRLIAQRPGANEDRGTPSVRGLSRRQLLIRRKSSGTLAVDNVGRCPLFINGAQSDGGTVDEGDVLRLGDLLVFVCVRRPESMVTLREFPADRMPAFGRSDAFGLVGESEAAWRLREQIAFLGHRNGHVLVLGQSGTGKELVARAIHALSARRSRELVARNAATLPEALVDAELFGNPVDYPNPGMRGRPGLIGQAHGGTLFLDEIGELPATLQAHLLRVLDQDGEYHRLGEATARRSDLRLIAATNRELESLKHDFAARLKLRIAVPGLEQRREDIPLLAVDLLRGIAAKDPALKERFTAGDGESELEPRIDAHFIAALVRHDYTLHVRELESLLWRSLATSPGDRLELTDEVRRELSDLDAPEQSEHVVRPDQLDPAHVQAVLDANEGVQEKTWRALGLKNRHVLIRFIRKHGLRTRQDG